MLPVKDPRIITLPGIFSLPSMSDFSEMIVISFVLVLIFPNIPLVDYLSDSSSLQSMPWSNGVADEIMITMLP
jgi:hypothetical protein